MLESFGPEAGMMDPQAVKRARMVEERNESRPRSVEIGQKENWAFVGLEWASHVMRISPAAQHNGNGCFRRNVRKYSSSLELLGQKTVLSFRIIGR